MRLEQEQDGQWKEVAQSQTDGDGRVRSLLPSVHELRPRRYRIGFATGEYFRAQGIASFYPYVEIAFTVDDPGQSYHVPLLVTPHSYSTYRGS